VSSPRIGVGIIGLSANRGWAARAHVPALAMLADYDLRGLVASGSESAKAAALKYRVPFASDRLDELLARSDIDLVVVSVGVPEHRRVVEASLKAGKAVLCEWPLARDLAEAEALAAIAKDALQPCFVNLQARNSPAVRFIGDLLDQGYVGQVLSTSVIAAAGSPWGAEHIQRAEAMYQARENGATILSIPVAHMLDVLSALFGALERPRATLAVRRSWVRLQDTEETVDVTAPDQVCVSVASEAGWSPRCTTAPRCSAVRTFIGESTALRAISWCRHPVPTCSLGDSASRAPQQARNPSSAWTSQRGSGPSRVSARGSRTTWH
jgi:predicted dehydrogenase